MADLSYAASKIRTIDDWPTLGIIFKDVTPLLADPKAMTSVIQAIAELGNDVDLVAGIEARGFVLASAVAHELNKGFIPIRKKGKLPYKTHSQDYGLEYGAGTLEMHIDAVQSGQKVLLIDDVLATGGDEERDLWGFEFSPHGGGADDQIDDDVLVAMLAKNFPAYHECFALIQLKKDAPSRENFLSEPALYPPLI